MELNERQEKLCTESTWDFSGLRALFLNCTLKKSPELSHTEGLIRISRAIMERNGVSVEVLRPVDHDIATGVWPDMTGHGWDHDDWPELYDKVKAADILVLTTSIWLGEKTSVCTQIVERLYASSGDLNEQGQYAYYGRVGGCLVHRQRRRRQALLDEYPLFAAASRLRHTAAGRRRLAWRGRPRTFIPGSRFGRPRERLHQPQHDVHDVEPHAHGAHDQECRRDPRPRQPALVVGRWVPVGFPEPRASLV